MDVLITPEFAEDVLSRRDDAREAVLAYVDPLLARQQVFAKCGNSASANGGVNRYRAADPLQGYVRRREQTKTRAVNAGSDEEVELYDV